MKGESEHRLPKSKLMLHEYPLTVIHGTDSICKELRIHELQMKFYV